MATMTAAAVNSLASDEKHTPDVHLATIGSPRVFDKTASDKFADLRRTVVHRYTLPFDVVPHIPPKKPSGSISSRLYGWIFKGKGHGYNHVGHGQSFGAAALTTLNREAEDCYIPPFWYYPFPWVQPIVLGHSTALYHSFLMQMDKRLSKLEEDVASKKNVCASHGEKLRMFPHTTYDDHLPVA